ncbi:MAG: FKBP-type peptidyl-prolyl cis-trans isomerase [Polyangiaceae bacterium]
MLRTLASVALMCSASLVLSGCASNKTEDHVAEASTESSSAAAPSAEPTSTSTSTSPAASSQASAPAPGASDSTPSRRADQRPARIEHRENGLVIEDTLVGSGAPVLSGSRVKVRYVGKFIDGTVFDRTTGSPFEADIGQHHMIEGWEQGILGMREGGRRTLTIPPSLGYGARGVPPKIPPNATLIFELELVSVQ